MLVFRAAEPSDIEGIASLHVTSWQENYRGAFSDTFLDAEAILERRLIWDARIKNPDPNQFVQVAEWNNKLVGFVCAYFDHSPEYGTLLDNLHVSSEMKGKGIGTRLMALVAKVLKEQELYSGLYLWVLEQNEKAHDFYIRIGGTKIETVEGHDIGDRPIMKTRYFWKSVDGLLARAEKKAPR